MDLSKLSTGDKLIFGGAIVFLISMFLPWYGVDFGTGLGSVSYSNSGASYVLTGWLPLLLIVLVVAKIAIGKFSPSTKLPNIPIPWSQAILGAAGAAAVLVILRLAIASSKVGGVHVSGGSLDRKYGLIIALIASVVVAAGAYLKYQAKEEDGESTAGGATPPQSF